MGTGTTIVTWPNDYIVVRTVRSFEAETSISSLDGDSLGSMDALIAQARNKNYGKIVKEMKKYLDDNDNDKGEGRDESKLADLVRLVLKETANEH